MSTYYNLDNKTFCRACNKELREGDDIMTMYYEGRKDVYHRVCCSAPPEWAQFTYEWDSPPVHWHPDPENEPVRVIKQGAGMRWYSDGRVEVI